MIDLPKSDLDRSIQHNSSQDWPESVKIQLLWRDKNGAPVVSTQLISADQFFGTGSYGAPLDGSAVIQMIERLRRQGPPEVKRKGRR
jgi:hypothetical protein